MQKDGCYQSWTILAHNQPLRDHSEMWENKAPRVKKKRNELTVKASELGLQAAESRQAWQLAG
jgi:hypothetical protein